MISYLHVISCRSLQLCVNVQMPKNIFGLGGAAVFIDTNCGFTTGRLKGKLHVNAILFFIFDFQRWFVPVNCASFSEIATATSAHCDRVFNKIGTPGSSIHPPTSDVFNVNTIKENIHYLFCYTYIELVMAIYALRELLQKHSEVSPWICLSDFVECIHNIMKFVYRIHSNRLQIRLVVIDSFSYLLRDDSEIPNNRVQLMYEMLWELQELAIDFKCAVSIVRFSFACTVWSVPVSPLQIVITNELTTRIYPNGESALVPALGDSHSHRVNYQIITARHESDNNIFVAKIKKSFWNAEKLVPFRVSDFDSNTTWLQFNFISIIQQVSKDGIRQPKQHHK